MVSARLATHDQRKSFAANVLRVQPAHIPTALPSRLLEVWMKLMYPAEEQKKRGGVDTSEVVRMPKGGRGDE